MCRWRRRRRVGRRGVGGGDEPGLPVAPMQEQQQEEVEGRVMSSSSTERGRKVRLRLGGIASSRRKASGREMSGYQEG